MRPLAAVERFFERLFERPTARLFRTRLQPVQLQRRIERAMEAGRRSAPGRVIVPDRYTIMLHPDDMAAFAPTSASLTTELADAALSFARAHHYALLQRPSVAFDTARSVGVGEAEVEASFGEHDPAAVIRDDATMAFQVPAIVAPAAVLRVVTADGSSRTVELDGSALTIGRAPDNSLVLDDAGVSRHHARIQARRGSLVLTDLESTNGTWMGGMRIDEVALGVGDRIDLGATALVVESVAEAT
jgi:hypothetical protein